jgi:outer membrane lipoprotein-sorting protein
MSPAALAPVAALVVLALVAALVVLAPAAAFSVLASAAAHFYASLRSFSASLGHRSRAGERSRSAPAWLSRPCLASQR